FKKQEFLETCQQREFLSQNLNINEKLLIIRIIKHILYNFSVFFKDQVEYEPVEPEILEIIDIIKNILDSSLHWQDQVRKIFTYIDSMRPPQPDDRDFRQLLKEFQKQVLLFPFLKNRLEEALFERDFFRELPESYQKAIRLFERMKQRFGFSRSDDVDSKYKDIVSQTESLEKTFEFLQMLANLSDLTLEDLEDLADFMPILALDEGVFDDSPENPFEISEDLKASTNKNRKSKLDQKIEKELENAHILLEEASLKKHAEIDFEIVGDEATKEFREISNNFGLDAAFSIRSKFQRPFYKDLLDWAPNINDTFLAVIDKSDSMSWTQLENCKTICTALVQYAADYELEIGIIAFNDEVEKLEHENQDLFWNRNFYDLLEQLMQVEKSGMTSFDKILCLACEEIAKYQKTHTNQIRFLFLTDGIDDISDETYEQLKTLQDVKSLVIYIDTKEMPQVLKDVTEVLSANLLRIDVSSSEGSLRIIKEFLG
ncbi:MAG: hypothetical protein ACFFBD_14660, partial [Candidatus Hodarchaeota archaeon]